MSQIPISGPSTSQGNDGRKKKLEEEEVSIDDIPAVGFNLEKPNAEDTYEVTIADLPEVPFKVAQLTEDNIDEKENEVTIADLPEGNLNLEPLKEDKQEQSSSSSLTMEVEFPVESPKITLESPKEQPNESSPLEKSKTAKSSAPTLELKSDKSAPTLELKSSAGPSPTLELGQTASSPGLDLENQGKDQDKNDDEEGGQIKQEVEHYVNKKLEELEWEPTTDLKELFKAAFLNLIKLCLNYKTLKKEQEDKKQTALADDVVQSEFDKIKLNQPAQPTTDGTNQAAKINISPAGPGSEAVQQVTALLEDKENDEAIKKAMLRVREKLEDQPENQHVKPTEANISPTPPAADQVKLQSDKNVEQAVIKVQERPVYKPPTNEVIKPIENSDLTSEKKNPSLNIVDRLKETEQEFTKLESSPTLIGGLVDTQIPTTPPVVLFSEGPKDANSTKQTLKEIVENSQPDPSEKIVQPVKPREGSLAYGYTRSPIK